MAPWSHTTLPGAEEGSRFLEDPDVTVRVLGWDLGVGMW